MEKVAGRPVVMAFSGGVDSTVLLHLLVCLRDKGEIESLSAIHVHHGLSGNADSWADHCLSVCQQWEVPLQVVRVSLEHSSDLERQAREARYTAFEGCLPEGGCLVMGHHQDDQAETVLFRLLRGSGLDGVAGMPVSRELGSGVLFRPLLSITRQVVENYAENVGLKFVEDESNQDQRFRRNFLRHNLMPQIEAAWPGVSSRLAQFSEDVSEVNQLLFQQTKEMAEKVIEAPPNTLWGGCSVIDVASLSSIDRASAQRVLRYWLAANHLKMPDRVLLNSVFSDVMDASPDAEPVVQFEDHQLRRFAGKLVLICQFEHKERSELKWSWDQDQAYELPFSGGRLSVINGGEVRLPGGAVRILFRSQVPAGMKVAVKGRAGRKSIKRWLQEYKVPPWVRDVIPFIFHGNELIALPGIFVTEHYACEPHLGKKLSWKPGF
ncbi:tRNA lysidine(34) synthetase TilS [Endozoicomonas numazuensis]|nr:tRNA lysidine(34) synthetase TilS [Endozoicomonas numazuensis]